MTKPYTVRDNKTEPPQRYPRTRTVRGLLLQIRAGNVKYSRGRRLLKALNKSGGPGRCVWCSEPTRPRQKWHQDCVSAYFVAINTSTNPLGTFEAYRVCAQCGRRASIVDHDYAMGLAHEHRAAGRRGWWKAWTRQNLQWLCGPCHDAKTRHDVSLIAAARRARKLRRDGC